MIDIDNYLKEVSPINILDIINPDVLKNILNGYSYKLASGITIVFPDSRVETKIELKRIDAFEEEATDTFQGICAYWRKKDGCNKDNICNQCDNDETLKYFRNEWKGLRIFRCKPLSLWDMTIPIIINNQIIGVLFAGQIVVNHGHLNWKTKLADLEMNVDWKTTLVYDNHLETIKVKIEQLDIEIEKKDKLYEILDGKSELKMKLHDIIEFKERIKRFIEFGQLFQKLLDQMYFAQKDSAEQKLIGQFSAEFDTTNYIESAQFWIDFALILKKLNKIPGINNVELFTRTRSRYVQNITMDSSEGVVLYTSDVIQTFPNKKLIHLDQLQETRSINKLILSNLGVYGYRSDTGFGRELSSTLIVIYGKLTDEYSVLLEKICEVTCTSSNLALMIYRERNNDLIYQKHVSNIGHSFRTPLQAISLVLDKLQQESIVRELSMFEDVKYVIARIRDAKEDLETLLEPATKTEDRVDISKTLNYLIEYMKPIADKHPCKLVIMENLTERVIVSSNIYELQRALINLIDNAIKYSYRGRSSNGGSGLYEVRFYSTIKNNIVTITILNYGIGIPAEKLNSIKEYWYRGNVADAKKARSGLGLGLPYAIEIIEKIGGWLDIDSFPGSNVRIEDKLNYKRYVTQVRVSLPINK